MTDQTDSPSSDPSNLSNTTMAGISRVYNKYTNGSKQQTVEGYITDWSQYQRQFDLKTLEPTAYDRLVFSFMAIYGQKNIPYHGSNLIEKLNSHAVAAELKHGSITIVDASGDLRVGVEGWYDEFYQDKLKDGVLFDLRTLQEKAKKKGHTLQLAFSVGGWSLSGYFSHMAADNDERKRFIDSVIEIFKRFPMFSGVDIDWEYPGCSSTHPDGWGEPGVDGEKGNIVNEADGRNYAKLIEDLRKGLDDAKEKGIISEKKGITIAASCNLDVLDQTKIGDLYKAGQVQVYLMAYDFFGYTWAPVLAHHAKLRHLKTDGREDYSAEAAIDQLIKEDVPPDAIHLGYGAYGRSARGADLTKGTYAIAPKGDTLTPGTWETGAVEWSDIVTSYVDFSKEPPAGKDPFDLYNDVGAVGDYVYSDTRKVFLSCDTPRTVREKSKYAVEKNLAGVFVWAADQDSGLLCNAAREGLGYELDGTATVDMSRTYKITKERTLGPFAKHPTKDPPIPGYWYLVISGDGFWGIAKNAYGEPHANEGSILIQADKNNEELIKDGLHPGMIIYIPKLP